jgi:hypothetical protein
MAIQKGSGPEFDKRFHLTWKLSDSGLDPFRVLDQSLED